MLPILERLFAEDSYWRLIVDQAYMTCAIQNWEYRGAGTEEDPYVIGWIDNDRRNPTNLAPWIKWGIVVIISFNALAVSFVPSACSGALPKIMRHFEISEVVGTLGLSLYVLGFGVGPLLWAPLSEVYGRQVILCTSYGVLTLFNLGVVFSQNVQTLLILRFFAGTFGASPLTNTGGVIVDIFTPADCGIAMNLFAVAPFMGPAAAGWRWACGLMTLLCGISWLLSTVLIPETFAPVLLRRRAERLSKMTGKIYVTQFDKTRGQPSLWSDIKPIVLALAVYMSIIYGTLYLLFGAYPFVFKGARGWSDGIANLPFLGILVGMLFGIAFNIWDNRRYVGIVQTHRQAPPEARLLPAMVGAVILPIGQSWFAWTNYPSIAWICPVIASSFFGFSMILIFVSGKNYLADLYTIFAASALASTVLLRSIFGAVFPLLTPYVFRNLGIHWASSIPAFLSVACAGFPFVFHRYEAWIRKRCKFSQAANIYSEELHNLRSRSERKRNGRGLLYGESDKMRLGDG
ncbi:hypothetical protein BDV12DRAFT_208005 [Aspergillus spectabilis]